MHAVKFGHGKGGCSTAECNATYIVTHYIYLNSSSYPEITDRAAQKNICRISLDLIRTAVNHLLHTELLDNRITSSDTSAEDSFYTRARMLIQWRPTFHFLCRAALKETQFYMQFVITLMRNLKKFDKKKTS